MGVGSLRIALRQRSQEVGINFETAGEAIREAASGLKAGEYSEIISEDDMYHIIYMVGEETPGQKKLEDIREAVTKLALAEKQEEVWQTTQDEWTADRSIVTLYPDAYRPVGK